MVKVPHERGNLKMSLVSKRKNVSFFHDGFRVSMIVS